MKIIEIIQISIGTGIYTSWLMFGIMMLGEKRTIWPLASFVIAFGITLLFLKFII